MPGNWSTTVFIRVDSISSNQNSQRLANTKTFKKLIWKKETKRLGDLGPTDSNSPGGRGRKALHDKLPNTVPVPVWTPYLRNHRSTDCLPNDRLESRWFQDWFSSSTISSRTRMLLIFLMCIPRSLLCDLGLFLGSQDVHCAPSPHIPMCLQTWFLLWDWTHCQLTKPERKRWGKQRDE